MQLFRSIIAWAAPTRGYAVAFGLVTLAGLVSCLVPLFDLLGYESAALFGVVGGLAAMVLTLHAVSAGVVDAPFDPTRVHSPAADFFVLLVRHVVLVAVPASLLSLNALRVVNCSWQVGIGFWLAIAAGSVFCGQLVGWLAATLFSQRLGVQLLFCAAVVVLSAALPIAHLALEPPIVGHQLFLGYFSGSIYDEALSLPSSLVWYRIMHVSAAAVVLAAIEATWRARSRRTWGWMGLLAVVAALACAVVWWYRKDLGIAIDRPYIEARLDGRVETEHFVIHHPHTERYLRQRDQLAEDHEYRYDQLRRFFNTDPAADDKIHSYVYPNRDVKGELMGARNTLVAKLWLHEVHITWGGYGDSKLAHELAHIFTEPFGSGPLRLSMQSGVGVNMGLVEGAAAAAEWPADDLTPNQASAALYRLDLAPDIRQIVAASGFWTQSSGRAYTLVGSFVRYLIDEYGIETFKEAYPTGDFYGAYGRSAEELVDRWQAHIEGLELSEEEMELARYKYDQPSIFEKVCARQLGELQRKARAAADRGDVGRMNDLYEEILEYAPDNVNYRIAYARATERARQIDRAAEMVDELLDEEYPPVVQATLFHLRGDLAWRQRDHRRAERSYDRCLDQGVTGDDRRLLHVKLGALERDAERGRRHAFEYLLARKPSSVAFYHPMRWFMEVPDDELAAYLVARRLWSNQEFERAIDYLEIADHGLDSGVLEDETVRMLGAAHYFEGDLQRARRLFERLAASELPFYREQRREWLDRIAWKGGNRIRTQ